jgi:hypothetical protein
VEIGDGQTKPLRFTRQEEQEATPPYALPPLTPELYLYEPHAALLKAGAYKLPAVRYGMNKLSSASHLYLSPTPCQDFAGRGFQVEDYGGFGKQELHRLLGDIKQANLTVRGFPSTVAELRRRLHLREGGNHYLFAATAPDGRHVLLRCRKIVRP